ncbi:unnamed protein product [Camellia sinensis]
MAALVSLKSFNLTIPPLGLATFLDFTPTLDTTYSLPYPYICMYEFQIKEGELYEARVARGGVFLPFWFVFKFK